MIYNSEHGKLSNNQIDSNFLELNQKVNHALIKYENVLYEEFLIEPPENYSYQILIFKLITDSPKEVTWADSLKSFSNLPSIIETTTEFLFIKIEDHFYFIEE
jgi:hypothetical protein